VAPNYINEQIIATLHLLHDLCILLGRLGWLHFVTLQEPAFERLVWELMSFLLLDLERNFRNDHGYIRFRLFNQTVKMCLAGFNGLFQLTNGA